MPQRKMSLSMKRAIVLNKGETDELQRRVGYLRKSRDEALMELQAERLRLQIRKANDCREESAKGEEIYSEEIKPLRRPSLIDRNNVEKERPKSLFPPLKGINGHNTKSASEPSTPTSAFEFKIPNQSDLRNNDCVPKHGSVQLRKLDKGKLLDSACSTKKGISTCLSDYKSTPSEFRALGMDSKFDDCVLPKHDRKTSRFNFDDKLAMLKLPKRSLTIARRNDKKHSGRKKGLPELINKVGHQECLKNYEGYKTE